MENPREADADRHLNDVPRLRLWPGVAASVLIVFGFIFPDIMDGLGLLASAIGAVAVFIWWLFFSRARWVDRLGAMVVMVAAWIAMRPLLDKSILGGAMGALPVFGFTVFAIALVVWAAATPRMARGARRASLVVAMVAAAGLCTLVRTAGIHRGFDLHWRWTPSPEELLLAQPDDEPAAIPAETTVATAVPENSPAVAAATTPADETRSSLIATESAPEWPGFRGIHRDGAINNVHIQTDWATNPPAELWRRPIGPGWSSFAVAGDVIYTQEQRGEDEIVASYNLATGQPVWRHRDAVRFWESNAGAGPRGTPTVSKGRVFAFGATGILNALDARTGAVVWSRNAAADTKTEVPTWGFSSSPLVTGDQVIIATSGTLAAYDIATGKPRWVGPTGGFSYSSPQLVSIAGVPQVLLLSGSVISVSPDSGEVLWQHAWDGGSIVQPATLDDGVLINSISVTGGQGVRRLAVALMSGKWTVEERWTSAGLKPYFNDFVVHDGHAFGFDGSILSCIDLNDGKRKWKGGRYGSGQLVLLTEQNLLLVLSDEGELALVRAAPDAFQEVARFKAIEGKTWNHPVLIRDTLLVRNGEEMAAFRLAETRSAASAR
jgi:outer membrane protein assembly factor BamB